MKPHRRAALILCLALVLRGLRALCRWDEWALHYSGYYTRALDGAAWTGLHPPLYGWIHGCLSALYAAPILWLLWSAALSSVAVWALLRSNLGPHTWLVALLVASDPVQLHYAAEVNNYPMLAGLIGLAWWARSHERWALVGLFGIVGAWTHVLGGLTIGLIALTSVSRWRALAIMAAGVCPLLPGAIEMLTDAGHQRQPELLIAQSFSDALDRFSPSFIFVLPLLVMGVRAHPQAAIVWGGTLTFWIGMVLVGLAAPHQFPYALALGVPAAVLVSAAVKERWLVSSVAALCIVRAAWVGGSDLVRLSHIYNDADANAAVTAVTEATQPGDAIVLVRGLQEQDDDKRHTSAVLWRFPPWEQMEDAGRHLPDGRRHLSGSPRSWRGTTLYTFDEARASIAAIPAHRVFTIAYGSAEAGSDIPRHASQDDWVRFGSVSVRFPK